MSKKLKTPKPLDSLVRLIVTARKRRRWTQQELAERSGVNLATLRKFEQSGRISTDRLARLLDYLGLETVFNQAVESMIRPELPGIDDLLKAKKGARR